MSCEQYFFVLLACFQSHHAKFKDQFSAVNYFSRSFAFRCSFVFLFSFISWTVLLHELSILGSDHQRHSNSQYQDCILFFCCLRSLAQQSLLLWPKNHLTLTRWTSFDLISFTADSLDLICQNHSVSSFPICSLPYLLYFLETDFNSLSSIPSVIELSCLTDYHTTTQTPGIQVLGQKCFLSWNVLIVSLMDLNFTLAFLGNSDSSCIYADDSHLLTYCSGGHPEPRQISDCYWIVGSLNQN